MKLLYGYVLVNEKISVHEEKADVVRSILGLLSCWSQSEENCGHTLCERYSFPIWQSEMGQGNGGQNPI